MHSRTLTVSVLSLVVAAAVATTDRSSAGQ